jgi:hypothetical protein
MPLSVAPIKYKWADVHALGVHTADVHVLGR